MIPNNTVRDIVSILGLARSPTLIYRQICIDYQFQYLGSRGAQLQRFQRVFCILRFQYLGSRGAQRRSRDFARSCFSVSILGLARSPTATRVARAPPCRKRNYACRFRPTATRVARAPPPFVSILGLARSPTVSPVSPRGTSAVSILGLARSPTSFVATPTPVLAVSILGLARSPTIFKHLKSLRARFQYLGSRGAQLRPSLTASSRLAVSILGLARSPTQRTSKIRTTSNSFNTWAREEPNIR